ncbi:MAG TPA: flavin reductase family protein [Acidimicrobiales bacterium]|nr:flavin reductase family protein [Acidimicrobiales bacterium]
MSSPEVLSYKDVVGHFATGVAVVTAATPDGPTGFTCQTFGSLSLDPMLITFSAYSAGHSWPRARDVGRVAVSVLASDQEALARVFATSGVDKFADIAWSPGPEGSPLLDGALAHFEGQILGVSTHGDHDQVVATVDFARAHPGRPLLYYHGGFTSLT